MMSTQSASTATPVSAVRPPQGGPLDDIADLEIVLDDGGVNAEEAESASDAPAAGRNAQAAKAYGKKKNAPVKPATSHKEMEAIILAHSGSVRRHARRYARMSGGAVEADDLISVGVMGLIDAHSRFDPSTGRPFRVYAEYRIRGAILDELRRLDPMSQPRRREARKFERAVTALATEIGREPSEAELAVSMEMPLAEVQRRRRNAQEYRFVPEEDARVPDARFSVGGLKLERPAVKLLVRAALERLAEREQQIMMMYYFHDMNMREIGAVLDLTEARISQLHKRAVADLKVSFAGE